ncbi:hypothetical protein STEG23_006343, partial [Scotinomys teguina]
MTVTPLGRDQDYSLKIREPDVPAPWFLDPGGWSKTAMVSLYFIFPGICTLSLEFHSNNSYSALSGDEEKSSEEEEDSLEDQEDSLSSESSLDQEEEEELEEEAARYEEERLHSQLYYIDTHLYVEKPLEIIAIISKVLQTEKLRNFTQTLYSSPYQNPIFVSLKTFTIVVVIRTGCSSEPVSKVS